MCNRKIIQCPEQSCDRAITIVTTIFEAVPAPATVHTIETAVITTTITVQA